MPYLPEYALIRSKFVHRTRRLDGSWKPGSVTIIADFRSRLIRGTFLFHCHILDHEDAGMMAKIQAL